MSDYEATEQDRKNGVRTVTYQLGAQGVTPEIAHHALAVLDGGAQYVRPGSFVTALLGAMSAADSYNLALLREIFPAYAYAVEAWKNHAAGTAALRVIAARCGK